MDSARIRADFRYADGLEMIDEAGQVGSPETVVYVHHGNSAGAGVEH